MDWKEMKETLERDSFGTDYSKNALKPVLLKIIEYLEKMEKSGQHILE